MEKNYTHPTDAIACADRMLSILSRSLYAADELAIDADEIEASIATVREKLGVALEGLGYRWQNGRLEPIEHARRADEALREIRGSSGAEDEAPRVVRGNVVLKATPSQRKPARKARAAR